MDGDYLHQNKISEEDGKQIVHAHPFRFFICKNCMKDEFIYIRK